MASSGNFCAFNNTYRGTTSLYDHNLSVGNTRITQSNKSGSNHSCGTAGTHLFQSGKFYWEAYMPANQVGSSHVAVGILNAGDGATKSGSSIGLGITTGDIGINASDLVVRFSNTQTKDYSESAFSSGDILQVAVDADNGAIYYGKNNTFLGSSDPTSGSSKTNAGATWTPSSYAGGWVPSGGHQGGNGGALYMNWGQDSTFGGARSAGGNADENGFGDFVYSPPSGYLALCSANLPTSSDIDPAQTDDDFPQKNFNVVTFTGNGSTNAVTGLGFQPDLIWGFTRDGSQSKRVIDSTRGGASRIYSDLQDAADTSNTAISAFGADGFTAAGGYFNNDSGKECGAWCWRANGGTTSSNSSGDITSTVQANQAAGFSIITYSGNGSSGATIGHGLSSKPEWIIVKNLSDSGGTSHWTLYHVTPGATEYTTFTDSAFTANSGFWNNTEPTSTLITLGNNNRVNGSGKNYVCYAWHGVEGYSKFSSFTGNGNTDGTFIYTGFRPRLFFIKRDSTTNWYVLDTARDINNPITTLLAWDNSQTESTIGSTNNFDVVSNGLKIRTSGSGLNGSSATFYYGAWGDVPFKYNNTF